jgi:hypothetical protein
MLKRVIKYEDFEGNDTSDIYYFHLSKPELLELEVEHTQGFAKILQNIIEAKDDKELIARFKQIILMSYGVKSEDGKRFIKNDQLREEFSQTAAYSALFMELATDDQAAVDFLTGVLPRDLGPEIEKAMKAKEQEEKSGETGEANPAVSEASQSSTS